MEAYRSARQFGVSIILFTLLFRFFELGLPQKLVKLLPEKNDIPVETETGQKVRSLSSAAFNRVQFPFFFDVPEETRPTFTPEDAEAITLTNLSSKEPDVAALISAPLELNLASGEPSVLILHTHTTESYMKNGEAYRESAPYRTLDEGYNMLAIGDRIAEILESEGIAVIHDRMLHDYPSYNTAYTHARKATLAALGEHPGIQLVLDIHRDAVETGSGQLRTRAEIDGKSGAQLMLVMGCGNANLPNPEWEQNLSLGLKLQTLLERRSPGICRPICIRTQRFNLDVSPGALLVEVGAAGNSMDEALLAAEQLAVAIAELKNGG